MLKIASLLVISQLENYLETKLLFSAPFLAAEGLGDSCLLFPGPMPPEESEALPDQESPQRSQDLRWSQSLESGRGSVHGRLSCDLSINLESEAAVFLQHT